MVKDFDKRHRRAVEEFDEVFSNTTVKKTKVKPVVKKPMEEKKEKKKAKKQINSFRKPNIV